MKTDIVIQGDCTEMLKTLPDNSINCCVTSPPYYGLRDYGMDEQIGLEETPEEYIDRLVQVFREVKRVLKDDGTLWVNIGDSYATGGKRYERMQSPNAGVGANNMMAQNSVPFVGTPKGCKGKDIIGIPWMLAFALRKDGWYLRQDIIWHKPNPMPESVTDRCTKSHEYIFLLSKKPKYYFDHEAIQEPASFATYQRLSQDIESQVGSYTPSKGNGKMKAVGHRLGSAKYGDSNDPYYQNKSGKEWYPQEKDGIIFRNKRDVWSVTTKPCKEAHFAVFPEDLIEFYKSPYGEYWIQMRIHYGERKGEE